MLKSNPNNRTCQIYDFCSYLLWSQHSLTASEEIFCLKYSDAVIKSSDPAGKKTHLPLQCHHQRAARSRGFSQWQCSVPCLDHWKRLIKKWHSMLIKKSYTIYTPGARPHGGASVEPSGCVNTILGQRKAPFIFVDAISLLLLFWIENCCENLCGFEKL